MRLLLPLACLLPALVLAQSPKPPTPPSAVPGLTAAPAAIVTPGNPYEALVPLLDVTPAAEAAALREALATVLSAVSGQPDIRTNPDATPILERAAQLVQRYGNEQDPVTQALMYRAAFDARAVDEALKRQGLPVFGLIAGAEQEWPVEVSGVGSFRDYGKAVYSVRRMRGVRSVQVQALEAGRLQMLVRFEGDATSLARAIASDAAFTPMSVIGGALSFALRPGG